MSDAPEHIWVSVGPEGKYWSGPGEVYMASEFISEYVRADLHATLEAQFAEVVALQKETMAMLEAAQAMVSDQLGKTDAARAERDDAHRVGYAAAIAQAATMAQELALDGLYDVDGEIVIRYSGFVDEAIRTLTPPDAIQAAARLLLADAQKYGQPENKRISDACGKRVKFYKFLAPLRSLAGEA
jgi:hypothetical protein